MASVAESRSIEPLSDAEKLPQTSSRAGAPLPATSFRPASGSNFCQCPFRHLRPTIVSWSIDDKGSAPGRDNQGVGEKIDRRIVADHHSSFASQNVLKAELVRLIECQFPARTEQALGQPDEIDLQCFHQAVEMSAGDPCNRATEHP